MTCRVCALHPCCCRGDLPYSATQVLTGVPNLIDDMNKHNLAFTVYDGDWKAGSPVNTSGTTAIQNCEDALYTSQIQNYFDSLEAPAMYAPGQSGGWDWMWTFSKQRVVAPCIVAFSALLCHILYMSCALLLLTLDYIRSYL